MIRWWPLLVVGPISGGLALAALWCFSRGKPFSGLVIVLVLAGFWLAGPLLLHAAFERLWRSLGW